MERIKLTLRLSEWENKTLESITESEKLNTSNGTLVHIINQFPKQKESLKLQSGRRTKLLGDIRRS